MESTSLHTYVCDVYICTYIASQQNGLRVMEHHRGSAVIRSCQNRTEYTSENCMDHRGIFHERPLLNPAGRLQRLPQHIQQRMYYLHTYMQYQSINTCTEFNSEAVIQQRGTCMHTYKTLDQYVLWQTHRQTDHSIYKSNKGCCAHSRNGKYRTVWKISHSILYISCIITLQVG